MESSSKKPRLDDNQITEIQNCIEEEFDALNKNLGTLPATSSCITFNFGDIAKQISEHAPILWAIMTKVLEKNNTILKNNVRRDILITMLVSIIAKFRNSKCNKLSLFVGLFLMSKGTPNAVNSFHFYSINSSHIISSHSI